MSGFQKTGAKSRKISKTGYRFNRMRQFPLIESVSFYPYIVRIESYCQCLIFFKFLCKSNKKFFSQSLKSTVKD